MEFGIPKAMSLPDPHARMILQEKCSQAAAKLRMMQVSVALGDSSALNKIKGTVATYIIAISTGNYNNLPCVSVTSEDGRKLSRLAHVCKIIIVAVVPIGCLIAARYAGLHLSPDFNNWAVAVTLLWAVITLVSILDPLYKSRIQEMQNVFALFGRSRD